MSIESAAELESAGPLLRHSQFRLYLVARTASNFSYQIAAVAAGWQIYELTNSALYLGLIGLAQFLPTLLLILVGGHVADRFDRNRIAQICQIAEALGAAYLAWATYGGWIRVADIFIVITLIGVAKSFESPAQTALLPAILPRHLVQRGTAMASGLQQAATIVGPALGGFAFAASPALPYIIMTVFWLIASVFNGSIRLTRPAIAKKPASFTEIFAGLKFVRNNPAILGTISLDLFAVLLGGATALLPIYAKDILDAGPWALGVLRASPAVGAVAMAAWLTHHAINRRAGMLMFQSVIVFGVATVVFALSSSFWLSVIALIIMGGADMVSVVIRVSLVQLATPDEMQGRVSSVNFLFINASNQLGEFRAGVSAALFGAVPAAAIGGVGTVLVALIWMRLFPTLRDVDKLG